MLCVKQLEGDLAHIKHAKKNQTIGLMLCCSCFYYLRKCDSGKLSHFFTLTINQVVKAGFKLWVIRVYILSIKKKQFLALKRQRKKGILNYQHKSIL